MASFDLLGRVDRALVAYIVSQGAGTVNDVFPARRSKDKGLPCTICWSHSGTPLPEAPYSGIFTVEAFVEVRTSAVIEKGEGDDEPRSDSADRVSATFDLFELSDGTTGNDLGDAITAAASGIGITIQNAKVSEVTQGHNPRTANQQGNVWIDSLHLGLVCCPSDLG